MKPKQLQKIYLPVTLEHAFVLSVLEEGRIIDKVIEKETIIFTPEQLNEYTQQVIKDALKVASENVNFMKECGKLTNEKCYAVFCHNCSDILNKESITNTFEQIYEKWKI